MTASKRDWIGGRVSSHAALDAADEAFWIEAGPAARFEASIELSFTAWSLRHPGQPLPRFGRDAFGVRRRRGATASAQAPEPLAPCPRPAR